MIYKGGQVVVPSSLREVFLHRLHSSHQESTSRRARDVVYWPGMLEVDANIFNSWDMNCGPPSL